ncbi:MAG TPA: leucyl aminopeptidase [Solirubrobacterales bacterium]|jgi:leucyl aminopeptidase|nr:leucyl aminopeptidase [Solirubrobacterales bacterium]
MNVDVRQRSLRDADAALVAVGLYEGDSLPEEVAGAPGAGDAKGSFKAMTRLYPGGPERLLVVGLGERDALDAEKLRVLAALVAAEAAKVEATSLAWALPAFEDEAAAAEAIVTGTVLGAYRFDRFKGKGGDDDEPKARLESLTLLAPAEFAGAAETARVYSEAANRARDLQETPANYAKPEDLAARAEEIAADSGAVTVEILDGDAIRAKGMGGLAAVTQGGPVDARLIVLRYAGGGDGPTLGFVGKGVTFDTGGIVLKPGAGMQEMKFDMSGAAAVLEATAAIAELGLPIDLITVVPSTENMPSGTAVKPGDVITQYNGTTVEVNNTDAEGRLILADALAYAIELGAERIVDLATLTGAMVTALGSTYAGVHSNDDALADELVAAGAESGELTWRMPLHPEYADLMKGTVADLSNLSKKREAGSLTAASFLREFVDDTPWAHVDIAGTAWDVGRAYTGKGGSGYGVRLLVQLARDLVD